MVVQGYHDEFQDAVQEKLEKKRLNKNHLIKNSFDVVVTGTAFYFGSKCRGCGKSTSN